jgi:hypothetical protein
VDDAVVVGGSGGPVNLHAVRLGGGFELDKIVIEVGERVLLDLGGEFPQLFPFCYAVARVVAMLPDLPDVTVVHLQVAFLPVSSGRRMREAEDVADLPGFCAGGRGVSIPLLGGARSRFGGHEPLIEAEFTVNAAVLESAERRRLIRRRAAARRRCARIAAGCRGHPRWNSRSLHRRSKDGREIPPVSIAAGRRNQFVLPQ